MGLTILRDSSVEEKPQRLNDAWESPESFVFVADKSGIEGPWIEQALAGLPSLYKTQHFILLTSGSTGQPKLVIGSKMRAEELVHILHEKQNSETVKEAIVVL